MEQILKSIHAIERAYELLQSLQIFATENNIAAMYEALSCAKTAHASLKTVEEDMRLQNDDGK